MPDSQKQPKILPRFSFTHQITRHVFERIRDDTDYTDSAWAAPRFPGRSRREADCSKDGITELRNH